jgi:hypothetical protein
MNELVVTAVLEAPELAMFHTIQTGIKNDREIGIIPGTLGLIGKAAQGCDPTADTLLDTAVLKTWAPKRIEVIIDQCATDIASSMAKLARKLGIEVNDLTGTEYFAFLLDLLAKDIPKMIFRHAWFGNTSVTNVSGSPAGYLTDGVSTTYFNIINGFFYQLAVLYTATAARKTAITGNSQATYALQESVATPALVFADINTMIDAADPILVAQPDRVLLVTHSIAKRLKRQLQTLGVAYKTELVTAGMEIGEWDGIKMYTLPLWDQWIRAYEDNGTKYNNPHRAVYTTVSNLNIGMEGTTLFDNVNSFYDKKSRVNRIEVSDAFDAKIIDDRLFQMGL